MDNIKIEIWKDIIGYEGYYQISNLGNVKSLNRIVKNKNGYRNTGERLLKIYLPKDSQHYPFVILCKNGKTENKLIHRLVATAFVTNDDPIHKTQVNHIDENKMNNSSDNLEWCTPKYNAEYGTRIERTKNLQQIINRGSAFYAKKQVRHTGLFVQRLWIQVIANTPLQECVTD